MNNVVSLDELFHKRLFRVPDYQRGYSWDERQVREFLEDLALLRSDRYHYTGTVVLHQLPFELRMDDEGHNYASVDIVDGQQRLTTIILLLDGIRRSLNKLSGEVNPLSRGITKNYIAAQTTSGHSLFKLSLNEDTDRFFKNVILSDESSVDGPRITSEKRLDDAKKQITEYLISQVDIRQAEAEEWLHNLYKKISTQLRFTLYQVEDEAEVGIIFEVMNDRGKPLTELEKVKNYLLYTSTFLHESTEPNELAKSINSAWANILRQLMAANLVSSADEDRLLRAHWLTYYDPQARKWEGSKSIKEEFSLQNYSENDGELFRSLNRYTETLRASCISFCDAYRPNRHDAFGSFNADPKAREQVVEWSEKLERNPIMLRSILRL